MPSIAGYMPTLIAASAEYAETFYPKNTLLHAVTLDVEPVEGDLFSAINVNIPKPATTSNVGAGNFVFSALDSNSVPITLNTCAQAGYQVPNFTQLTSPIKFVNVFLRNIVKGVFTSVDQTIATTMLAATPLATTVRNVNGASDAINTAEFNQARQELASNYVDVEDPDNMSYIVNEKQYFPMLELSDWVNACSIGSSIAENIHTSGKFNYAYSTRIDYDQNLATVGSGSGAYQPGILTHRYSTALVARKSPVPGDQVEWYDLDVAGIPIRVMISFFHQTNSWYVSGHVNLGCAVIRPEALVFTSAFSSPPTS